MNYKNSPQHLKNILHSEDINLTFISNPKVACSTIKNSLLGGFDGNVHQESEKRFHLPQNINHEFFCITRNPYSRALSCFKNKIGPNKEINPNAVWFPFCERFDFSRDNQPSFGEYLQALIDDPDPASMDMHYRCQHYNLHNSDIKPAYVGRLEHFDKVEEYLNTYNIKIIERNSHRTGSYETYRDEINADEAKLIEIFYNEDFETYGYEKELTSTYIPEPLHQEQIISADYQKIFSRG